MENKIKIIFEDKNYLVINKPAGLLVHSDGKKEEYSLVDWVMENYKEMEDVGEPTVTPKGEIIKRPGIVHRLDRETSGVMVLAKNQKSYEHLKNQFKERETGKTYKAFVYGVLKNDEGVIVRPIGRSSQFGLWSAQRGARGEMREAITEYKVLERGGSYSFLELKPQTGRTHQIRVHLKAINYPVVADSLYAPKKENILGFKRLALHAESLEFNDMKNKKLSFTAPLPEDFIVAKQKLKKIAE